MANPLRRLIGAHLRAVGALWAFLIFVPGTIDSVYRLAIGKYPDPDWVLWIPLGAIVAVFCLLGSFAGVTLYYAFSRRLPGRSWILAFAMIGSPALMVLYDLSDDYFTPRSGLSLQVQALGIGLGLIFGSFILWFTRERKTP